MDAMNVLELRDILFQRGGRTILSKVDWTIEPGQHWALLGVNGSGKTTLLKIVTGYEWPTDGTVRVLGELYGECNLPALRKTIGWVSFALLLQMPARDTALEVVLSGLDSSMGLYREFTPDEVLRAQRALASVNAATLAHDCYQHLSQGEQQRVLIARALVNEPMLLILDEPCSGLDPAARDAFLRDLRHLCHQERAPNTILVTHHIEEVGDWIDRVMVLREGRTLACGLKADVLNSTVLSEAFGRPCRVSQENGTFYLRM
ncbi:MAG: ATP-binding cassette domain-containing protein [Phycisphaerae bacterium]|nr:ATP-binding cassette domain-containing protein [Phycisphaerae bacterium]